MKSVKYLLIGAGLASQRAAAKIRERDAAGSILMVGREGHLPYDHPPLSKDYMQGKTPVEKVFLQPREFYQERAIELALGQTVDQLDAAGKTAALSGEAGGSPGGARPGETVRFEKALIATGGRPIPLDVPGATLPGVHYLRTLDDAEAISREASPGRRCVIVGGGFIGLELACSLTQRGVTVTLLERGERIWRRFADERLSAHIEDHCTARGVTILKNERVVRFGGNGRVSSAVTASGRELPCDFVCAAIGVLPNVELARRAGLEMDNGIVVNDRLQTSNPDIYAAGDVVNFPDPHAGRRRRVEHWGGADYGGGLAGGNMAGGSRSYDILTYVWSDLFDLHLEFAGDESPPEKIVVRGGFSDKSFAMLYLTAGRLAAYYAVNYKRKQYLPLQKLITSRLDLAGREAQLQDPAFDVSTLLAPEPPK